MSPFRLEIRNFLKDTRALTRAKKLRRDGFAVDEIQIVDVYTIAKDFSGAEREQIGTMLTNPLFEDFTIAAPNVDPNFDWSYAIEIGFLPGVTDNVAHTVSESIEDLFKIQFQKPEENVYYSQITFLKGKLDELEVRKIAESFANPLIQRIHIKSAGEFQQAKGMGLIIPKVELHHAPQAQEVNLEVSDAELTELGKAGIANADGTRRGPLALSLKSLLAIREYFRGRKRNPTDVELESIAQTWSEHCKHTIFANPLDEITEGIYQHYIKRATQEIRQKKGKDDFCVSVFKDNAGGIIFDENYLITDKVETHNSPAALDPFGAAVTGIVGVNRDTIGFGKGAKPIMNRYGFCFGEPEDERPLYRGKNKKNPMLIPRQIMEGVIRGVYAGGNESGIPTPQGFMCFEDRYRGKPLVFVGTVGLIPREINGVSSAEKKAEPGDQIVVVGGAVGLDGIHGATFSSETLSSGSPATAVQIGDPITQKKLSDAIVKEARDRDLFHSITDNGAGGISCSIPEMAREAGGCKVQLDSVPLKYPNLSPWEIWISESQERMTLAVPPEKVAELLTLLEKHGVHGAVVGEFTAERKCIVEYAGKTVMEVEMEFLHEGLPQEMQKSIFVKKNLTEPQISAPKNLTKTLLEMLSRKNICGTEFLSTQYDHTVQGGTVVGPLQGRGRVNGAATIRTPLLGNTRGVVLSQGINSKYSDLDTYHMAACAIDTAIRQSICVGGTLDHLALLDNFCWCSSADPERLYELKEAARACYELATAYGTPYISGKDSMFNDFQGFDAQDQPLKISIPPTLLVSAIGVIPDVRKCVTLDFKMPGDLIYAIGSTKNELGGSEYFALHHEIGAIVPQVEISAAISRYRNFQTAVEQEVFSATISPVIGGLGVALLKMSIGGQLGLEIELSKIPCEEILREDFLLFSESQSRFIVTIDPSKRSELESLFPAAALIGTVRGDEKVSALGLKGEEIFATTVPEITAAYRQPFAQL